MEKIKSKKIGKKILVVFGVILGILLIALIFNFDLVQRLYMVINLFNSDVIVENFRTMGDKLNSRTISHSPDVFTFKQDIKKLPEKYTFNGKTKSVS